MIAKLFACRVVEGRTQFDMVPNALKQSVGTIIVKEFEMPELVPVKYGGTAE